MAVSTPPAASQADLPLNRAMRRDWAKGHMSSNRVLELSLAASNQGAHGVIRAKATWDEKHAHRDLLAAIGWPDKAPEIRWIEIPVGHKGEKRPHPVICPIETFRKIFCDFPKRWAKVLRGEAGACKAFWQSIQHHPIVAKHPVLSTLLFDKTLALGVHADAAPITKHESLHTIAWNSLHGSGTTMDTRLMFTCIKKSEMGEGTMDAFWDYFAWAMNALLDGKTPHHDWVGRPIRGGGENIAGGWRASCIQVRGDWEFYNQALRLARWDYADNCCWICSASNNQADRFWTDFSDNAGWRSAIRTDESWKAELRAAGKPVPNLFAIRGMRLEGVMVDTLHAVDQGLASHGIANVFVEVMSLGHWGSNQKSQAEGLQKDIHSWYSSASKTIKSSKVQGQLIYDRIKTSNDWPKLKAKAAATRHLARYAAHLAARYNNNSAHDQRRLLVVDLLVSFYDIIEQGGDVLTEDEHYRMAFIGKKLLSCYMMLSKEAIAAKKRLWKAVPKFHIFIHLCEIQCRIRNPRCFWAYADEDLQRHVANIASSCSALNLAPMIVRKWIILTFNDDEP